MIFDKTNILILGVFGIIMFFAIWGLIYGSKERTDPIINKTWETKVYTKAYKTVQDEGWDMPKNARLIWVESLPHGGTTRCKIYQPYYHYEIERWVKGETYILDGTYETEIQYYNVQETDTLKVTKNTVDYYCVVETEDGKRKVGVDNFDDWNNYKLDTVMTYTIFNSLSYE